MLNAQERYRDWLLHLEEDDPLRKELVAIENDENEIEERFYQNLAFGTAGLRGKTGAGTNRMNIYTVGKATQGIADYICSFGQKAMDAGVVIAHDPRYFSKEFCQLACSIYAANGIHVYTFPDLDRLHSLPIWCAICIQQPALILRLLITRKNIMDTRHIGKMAVRFLLLLRMV